MRKLVRNIEYSRTTMIYQMVTLGWSLWVYEELWVQEGKIILCPLTQNSYSMTISNISPEAIGPVVYQILCRAFLNWGKKNLSNGPGHLINMADLSIGSKTNSSSPD